MYEQMFIRTHSQNPGKLCGDLFLVEMWSHHPKRGVESGESSLPELYIRQVVNLSVGRKNISKLFVSKNNLYRKVLTLPCTWIDGVLKVRNLAHPLSKVAI